MARRLNPGTVTCLAAGCTRTFYSRDKNTNRICPVCSRKYPRDAGIRVVSSVSYHSGRKTNLLPPE